MKLGGLALVTREDPPEGRKIFKLQSFFIAGNDVMNNKFLMILSKDFNNFFFHIDIKTIIIKIIVEKSLKAEPPVCYGPEDRYTVPEADLRVYQNVWRRVINRAIQHNNVILFC